MHIHNSTSSQRAVGILIRDNKLLTFFRIRDGREYYVFPGGSVEEGETLEEALRRELKEEMCIDIKNPKPLFDFYNKVEGFDHGRTSHFYLITEFDGKPVLGGPEKERMNKDNQFYVHWLSIDDLEKIDNLYPEVAKDKLIGLYKNNKL